ncbi:MAG: hypothetical protein QM736_19670 [Vicinamibacterales bacterium]
MSDSEAKANLRLTGVAPSPELGAAESPATPAAEDLLERAREAVAAVRAQGSRDARGRTRDGLLNLRHGLYATSLLARPEVAAFHSEQVAAITTDLGGASELSALAQASVREAARLEVILHALGTELLASGVLTGKGKMRAATTTYLQVLDRFTRLAATLGLERRSRKVTFADAIAQEPVRE